MTAAVALVQLPIPGGSPAAARANVPLASGYLKSYAVSRGEASPKEIAIIAPETARRGGDEAVREWISGTGAAVVGFSVHMWNLQRTQYLARKIKETLPGVTVIAGGPEVAEGQPVLSSPFIDSFVIGEGEEAFTDALRDLREKGAMSRIYQKPPLPSLSRVPNPYLGGVMEREKDDPLYLETMRGCPHACAYCYYGKAYPRVRRFPGRRLGEVFAWARGEGVGEIYIMDPSFNSTPRWDETLRSIRALNTTGIPLHTEIRLESITPERAELFRTAGFRSVEVGLQSINPRALRAVGRAWRRDGFIKGAGLLRDAGVTVKTGVILGLPEDTPEGFLETVDFLSAHGLSDNMEVYPLSVLPGTRLKRESENFGLRYMGFPPYWVLSTPLINEEEMPGLIRRIERSLDIDLFPPIVPHFPGTDDRFLGFLDLRAEWSIRRAFSSTELPANEVTILLDGGGLHDLALLENLGRRMLDRSPFSLFRIVVESDGRLDGGSMDRLAEAFYFPGHYFNMIHYFSADPQARFSTRLYRLASRPDIVERDRSAGNPWEAVIRWSPELLRRSGLLKAEKPMLLLDKRMDAADESRLSKIYQGFEELLIRPGAVV